MSNQEGMEQPRAMSSQDTKQTAMTSVVDRLTDIENRLQTVGVELVRFTDRMLGVAPTEKGGKNETATDPSHTIGVVSLKLSSISASLSHAEAQMERIAEIG